MLLSSCMAEAEAPVWSEGRRWLGSAPPFRACPLSHANSPPSVAASPLATSGASRGRVSRLDPVCAIKLAVCSLSAC